MIKRAHWFEKQVAKHLITEALDTGRSNGLIRGSSIGSKCLRKLGYMILGYGESPTSAHSQYVLNFGNAFHDMVQSWMSRNGLVKATPYIAIDGNIHWDGDAEQNILDVEDGITGHYDGLTQPLLPIPEGIGCALSPSGKRYLLEFKTISNKSRVHAMFYEQISGEDYTVKYLVPAGKDLYADLPRLEGSPPKKLMSRGNEEWFERVKENNIPPGTLLNVIHKPGAFSELTKPKEEHIEQATYYASRLKADGILIVYLAKDFDESSYESQSLLNIPIKAYEVDISTSTIDGIRRKASAVWNYLEEGRKRSTDPEAWLPPRAFSPDEPFSECKYCSYSYTCHPENEKVKQSQATKFMEQAVLNLPVSNGRPFQKHGPDDWGRDAAIAGRVKDTSKQRSL